LAYILISAGNQVGLVTFNQAIDQFCPLGHGRQQYKKLHQLFDQIVPQKSGGDSLLHLCAPYIKQSATVIVISDFLQTDFMQKGMDKLYHSGHQLHVLQTISPDETKLVVGGQMRLADCESGVVMQIESTAENSSIAELALNQHCHVLALHCAKKSINYSLAYSNRYWKDVLVEHISRL